MTSRVGGVLNSTLIWAHEKIVRLFIVLFLLPHKPKQFCRLA